MANILPTARLKVKRSPGAVPPSTLEFGELAYLDGDGGSLWIGRVDGTIKQIGGANVASEAASSPIWHIGLLPPEDKTTSVMGADRREWSAC